MTRKLIAASLAMTAVVSLAASSARAAAIDVGTHNLAPDTPNQTIQINVVPDGGDPNVTGFNLRATIGDGTGGDPEPVFDFVDYTGGIWGDGASPSVTIPGGDPPDQVDPLDGVDTSPTAQNSVVFTNQGVDAAPDGLVATLNIDTTGITSNARFDLLLDASSEPGLSSVFVLAGGGDLLPAITNGEIIINTGTAQWDGEGGDENWSTAANWSGDIVPVAGDNLVFAGDVQTANTNDLSNFSTPSIAFDASAESFTLDGNALTIESGGAITNNSVNAQTFNLDVSSASPMTFDADAGPLNFQGQVAITSDTLTVAGDSDTNLTGSLAGAGDVAKTGDGALVLDLDSDADLDGFTGAIDVAAGSLRFVVDQDLDVDQTITGDAVVNKTGPAELTLAGLAGFTGELDVDDGSVVLDAGHGGNATLDNAALDLNGNTVAGAADVNAGGLLTGNGTVGDLSVDGGSLTPGDSIGTINVNGAAAFDAGSIFNIELAPGANPANDQVLATGNVSFADGATLNIDLFSGTLNPNDQFDVISGSALIANLNNLNVNSNVDGVDFQLSDAGNALRLTAIEALNLIWDGSTDADGDDTNFSDDNNFEDDQGIPADGGFDFDGLGIAFAADADGAAAADGGNYSGLGGVEFQNGLGAFTLDGGDLLFDGAASIDNNDPNTAVIQNNLVASDEDLTVNAAAGDVELQGDVDLAAGGDLALAGANDIEVDGVVSGAGGLTKTGAGDASLNNTNTFDGDVDVNDGRLFANDFGGEDAVPDASVLSVNGDGAFWINHDETIANIGDGSDGEIYLAAGTTLTFGGDDNDTAFDGVFEQGGVGFGSIVKVGDGVATLNGDSAAADSPISGPFNLQGGGFAFGNDGALGDGQLVIDAAGVSIAASGADRALANDVAVNSDFTVAGTHALTFSQDFNFANDTVDDQITVTVEPDASLIVDGVVDLTAGDTLVKAGDGVLALNANNAVSTIPAGTFVQVDAGTLRLGDANALGNADALDMQGGAVEFNEDGGVFTTDTTINADVAYIATQNATLGSDLSGANDITKQGDAALTLAFTDASGFTGDWIVEAGAIAFDELADLGGAGLSFAGGAVRVDDVAGDTLSIDTPIDVTANGGTINIADASDVVTLQDSTDGIDGDGGLTKTGPGKVILTGNNPYNGDTTLAAGILGVASDTALGNGALIIQGGVIETTVEDRVISNPLSIEGDFTIGDGSGSDNIDFTGAATLTTNATITVENQEDNEFVGPTLDLGANTLAIAGAQDLQIGNDISGDGGLTKEGTGTTTLTGDNAHTGVTTVLDGTLVLLGADVQFQGETIGNAIADAGDVAVDTGATLQVDKTEAVLNLIDGPNGGGDVQLGDNDLIILGDQANPFTGSITGDEEVEVEEGATFFSDGNINSNVRNRGRFGGNPNITGNFTNEPGGTHAPGNSIGTTVIAGDYNENGTLEIEVNGSAVDESTESDLVDVNAGGQATIDDAAVINVLGVDGGDPELADGDTFKIIDAEGGILINLELFNDNANGERIVEDFPTFDFILELSEGGDELFLTTDLSSILAVLQEAGAGNANQLGIAGAVDDANIGGGDIFVDFTDEIDLDDTDAVLAGLNELAPTISQPTRRVTVDNARATTLGLSAYLNSRRRNAPMLGMVNQGSSFGSMLAFGAEDPSMLAMAAQAADEGDDEAASAFEASPADGGGEPRPSATMSDNRIGAFARGLGVFQSQDGDGDRAGFDADAFGGMAGVDYQADNDLLLGLSLGYVRSEVDLDDQLGNYDTHTVRVGPYVSWNPAPWFVDASLTYGYHDFDSTRNVPMLGQSLSSDHTGHDATAFARLGHEWQTDFGLYITPEVAGQYTLLYEEDYAESGGSAALDVDSRTSHSLRSRVGVTLSYPFSHFQIEEGDVTLIPEVYLGWEHEFLDDENIDGTFVSGGGAFSFDVNEADRDSIIVAAGMSAVVNDMFSAFFRYEGSYSGDSDVHGVTGGVRLRF